MFLNPAYPAHAELMTTITEEVRARFADPGCQEAHDARCAAALVIHYGGGLTEAFDAAFPQVA